ncbi:MAG: aminotransferase class V-fold PLP-dependent enzyme [Planctomycetaceae bacterium]
MLDPASRARDFPALGRMVYLNTAAEGIPPPAVAEALSQYARDKALGMDGRLEHAKVHARARAAAAALVGLGPDDVAICSCSSEAYNLAALALRLSDGDEVVVTDLDFPASVTPFLQQACPATVKVWRSRGGRLEGADLAALLSPRTRLVSLPLVSFYNGFRADVPATAAVVARHSPALLAVDATQALGRIPLDRGSGALAGADLVVSSTHKWLLGPHGGGIVGVPPHRRDAWTVPAGGWFNIRDAFGGERFAAAESLAGAASFAVGMPNYPAIYGIAAALDYISGVGIDAIDRHAAPLVAACHEGLVSRGVEMLSPADPRALAGILAFRHPRAEAVHAALHARGIHVMHHAGRLRVAIHGYTTAADVEAFLSALAAAA